VNSPNPTADISKLIQWNCRGFRSNYEDILLLTKEHQPLCICLQETMLGATIVRAPKGYTITCNNSLGPVPGEGLAIMIRNDVPFYTVDINSPIQAMAIRIRMDRNITLCNLYIHPNEPISGADLTRLINQLPPPYIVMGDFNGRHEAWGDSINNQIGVMIENFILANDTYLLNTGSATHFNIQNGSTSCIDLTLCSPELAVDLEWESMYEVFGSDHFPIVISKNLVEPRTKEARFVLEKADWKTFEALTSFNIDMDYDFENINDMLQHFNSHIIRAATLAIPQTSTTISYNPVPWWNDACTETRTQKKHALRRYQRSRTIGDKIALKRARALARRTQRQSRRELWQNYISSINSKTPLNKIYKKVKKIQGQNCPPSAPWIIQDGRRITDPVEVSEALGTHFENVSSSTSYSPNFRAIKNRSEHQLDFAPRGAQPPAYNSPITENELKHALKTVRKTAPGADRIQYEMIKHLPTSGTEFLLRIYNRVWNEASFPALWRRATLLPFLKPGKPVSDPTSYRPIALTSCTCKLLEKIINNRLIYVLETNNCLSPIQYGFRKMRSTEDVLVRLQTSILDAFASNKHLVGIFFDISKAYDTTWKYGIMQQIHEFGIRGKLAYFIRNFLSDREFRVKILDTYSRIHRQEEGVPQGSVLSCTLFAVAINGLAGCLPEGISSTLYVDDFAIYLSTSHLPTMERRLQLAVNKIIDWTSSRGYRISEEKTALVHFTRIRGNHAPISITINNSLINNKDRIKFLGLIFDSKLTWKNHIESLRTSCIKSMNILKIVSRLRWGAEKETLLRLYRSLIRPKLDYGCHVYASAKPDVLQRLNPIHNTALRLCTGAFRSSPIASLYVEAGEMSLEHRRAKLTLQHYSRLGRLADSPTYNTVHDRRMVPIYERRQNTPRPFGIRALELMGVYDIQIRNCSPYLVPGEPPWNIPDDIVCNHLCKYRKSQHGAFLRHVSLEHITEDHSDSIHVYTDGSKCSGGVGYGVFSFNLDISKRIPLTASIFTAELLAIDEALENIYNDRNRSFTILTDSRSTLEAVQTPSDHPIISRIQDWLIMIARRHKTVKLCWIPSHVGLAGNEEADKLAKAGTENEHIEDILLPHKDCYPDIRKAIMNKWQTQWSETNDNKLRNIRDTIDGWPLLSRGNRAHEVTITRLRIGHTKLTHGYLMERGNRTYCQDCIVPLTIEHILSECPTYSDHRLTCFGNRYVTTRQLLSPPNYDIKAILNFLDKIDYLDKI